MTDVQDRAQARGKLAGPPKLGEFAHVSLPCRDIAEGKKFYLGVLGGQIRVDHPDFCAIHISNVEIGIGSKGCTFIKPSTEYPHIAFYCNAETMQQMKPYLAQFGIPSSPYWTRRGVEVLMFFRDPSGNMIELFCLEGFPGADKLPKGPPAAHGTALDVDDCRYESWNPPA
jgi:catechol 2,3-dioxygenase-like lactoylglutathione lyase family enzyme